MNKTPPRRPVWFSSADVVRGLGWKTGFQTDRITILGAVWDREAGAFAKHWALAGVRKGFLYVRPRSAAAAQELQLRGASVARGLNKYFKTAWIKGIKLSSR